jgi:hypothetical protein
VSKIKRYTAEDRLAAVEACLMMAGSEPANGAEYDPCNAPECVGPFLTEVLDEREDARVIDLCKQALWMVIDTIPDMSGCVEWLWSGPQTVDIIAARNVLDRELWAGAGELIRDSWSPGQPASNITAQVLAEIAKEKEIKRIAQIAETQIRCDSEPRTGIDSDGEYMTDGARW